jgi:nucleotide-binding universal stress UspA family protein
VHVVEPGKVSESPGVPTLLHDERALADGPSALRRRIQYDAVLNGVPYVSKSIYTHVLLGRPIPTLLQACVDFDADLLILGAHGQKGLQHLLIGSVAEQLLRLAHCPVLIARPKNYHGLPKSPYPSEEANQGRAEWHPGARSS